MGRYRYSFLDYMVENNLNATFLKLPCHFIESGKSIKFIHVVLAAKFNSTHKQEQARNVNIRKGTTPLLLFLIDETFQELLAYFPS
jgi:hypothetical protein